MDNNEIFKKINEVIGYCDISIIYSPLLCEIDCATIPFKNDSLQKTIILPKDKDSDPYIWAASCRKQCQEEMAYILIPGKKFDIYGTRHGHGRGWYDRFLEKIPSDWVRIGVIDNSKFSLSKLKKEVWDEPVDWIVVKENSNWQVYETGARINKR
ncbi:MAG: 5-formyltetrahydrofolate cyclo-ligase [Candidatus Paceibacterota bacterium]|jgi:5-formyltetrahydrofolate cyclo-ligase